jgi:hypothetical protein
VVSESKEKVLRAVTTLLILPLMVSMFAQRVHPSTLEEGILTRTLTVGQVRDVLTPASQWHPFPRISERTQWHSLPASIRNAYIHEAEKFLHADWPTPKATTFLEFVRIGDRSRYQTVSYERRRQLATLVLAECFEGKGRFRDDIVNGIWTICEETYWGVPAHVGMQRVGPGLPDVTEPTVDLFAAETGSLLAWTWYLLKDSLDVVSPLVSERIKYEVGRRINAVNLARDDFWWMGLTGRIVNNWDPWICSNWLATVLILEEDPDVRARSVHKIMGCLDRFVATYSDDGGCDEGPSYWGRAGGSLFDCLELLHSSTQGYVDVFAHPRVREIGRYIMRARIHGPWFVNFADASAQLHPDASVIFRYGKAIGDATMMTFGADLAKDQRLGEGILPGQHGILARVLPALFGLDDLLRTTPADPCIRDSWFPGIQVMIARARPGSPEGLFLAAQGGHNEESHNHNDVGNFIVSLDGEPVIIDIGVETYTAKTFGRQRYSIWTMQSAYHNLPTINGISQKEGRAFAAKDVHYVADSMQATLSMDIASAYPEEAGVRSWRRTATLERGSAVVIRDAYELRDVREPVCMTLMTCREPDIAAPGMVVLNPPPALQDGRSAELLYDASLFSARAEQIDITDPQLRSSWGTKIWRILLTSKQSALKHESVLQIRARR